jgi:hypothetical protein
VTSQSGGKQDDPELTDDPDDSGGAYFPLTYIIGMFDYFRRHAADINIMTYDELAWGSDFEYARNYPREHAGWTAGLRSGRFDRSKAHVVIQYDVDSVPARTLAALRHPGHRGMPANIMIFNRRIDRRLLKSTGQMRYTAYDIDDNFLRELQRERFVVGYHTNAYEQGQHDVSQALAAFDADVRALTDRFGLKFFSAHGGVPDANGRNNCDLPFHDQWSSKLRWVHNGYSPHFDGQFSDGGHNSLKRDPEGRDMRALVSRFRPGCRYRILLHPQYYAGLFRHSPRYGGTPWYDEMLALAGRGEEAAIWSDKAVARAGIAARSRSVLARASETVAGNIPGRHLRVASYLRGSLRRLLRG